MHEGIIGKGQSVAQAVENWNLKLKAHLRNAADEDVVVIYVKSLLLKDQFNEDTKIKPFITKGSYQKPKWTDKEKPQHVIDFENQFHTVYRNR